MRLTGSRAYTRPTPTPKMPPGLVELMEGLTKDVLKNNPNDLYEFCAEHMQKLLDIRDGNPVKKRISLEQKIKRAQEKVRQKIQNRLLQQNEIPKHYSETQEQEIKQDHIIESSVEPEIKTPIEDANLDNLPNQLVHREEESVKTSEVEISHEPNVTVTTSDIFQEPFDQQHESELLITVETEENTAGNDIMRRPKESCVVAKEDLPIRLEEFRIEELTKGIKNELKESNTSTIGSVPITSETLYSEELVEVKPDEKVNEINVKPVISNPHSTASSSSNIIEPTRDDPKPLSEIEHVIESERVTNESFTLNTESILQVALDQDVSSDLVDTLKSDEPIVDNNTGMESKDEEKAFSSLESKTVEGIKNTREENEANSVLGLNKTLDSESVISLDGTISNKPILINNDIHDVDIEGEKLNEVNSIAKNATDIKYEDRRNTESDNDEKNDSKEIKKKDEENHNKSGLEPRLGSKSSEVDSSSNNNPEITTNTDTKSQNVNEVQDFSRKIVENATVPNIVKNLERSKSRDHFENSENEVDAPKVYQNVIDTTLQFLEQEQQFSSELVIEEKAIIPGETTLTDSKGSTKEERDESNENSAVTGMDLETAAITIQKVFRTFLFSKSRTSTLEDAVNENSLDEDLDKKDEVEYVMSSANLNKDRRVLGISRMDTALQTVNEEKSLSQSTDDSSTLSSAATTIQAHVRGFLVRNKLASYKTTSSSSLVNSDGPSNVSLDGDRNEPKKTILNIHIVPERGQFMSRDESMLTSIDLPLDNSPPSSVNLHPLGYDKSEPRKQLKREDAIQSVSPPSNNSGKLSEEVDSVKDILNENNEHENSSTSLTANDQGQEDAESCDTTLTISSTADTVVDAEAYNPRDVLSSPEHNLDAGLKLKEAVANLSSDEMDVVTPFPNAEKTISSPDTESNEKPKLVHTGEFHDMVVQTQVKRSETSVVREFKNVLVYFLLWDKT